MLSPEQISLIPVVAYDLIAELRERSEQAQEARTARIEDARKDQP